MELEFLKSIRLGTTIGMRLYSAYWERRQARTTMRRTTD
ncbi:hypothetical protein LINGRAHAP2_LOCUS5204 [Linum grandiflorum]